MRRIVVNNELSPATNTGSAGGGVGHSIAHESAHKHVRGTAEYVDDLPLLPGTLFVATGPGTGTGVAVKAGSWEFNTNQGTSAEYLKLKSLALGAPDSFGAGRAAGPLDHADVVSIELTSDE